ncbi:MAG: alpha/beta fold hydrolase [Clostridiales bacterium]|nr:alpha/beta fold hydrolase [Clostridiales bacterium]
MLIRNPITCSARDGLLLKGACWYDDANEPSSALFIIHGMLEHIRRYEKTAAEWVADGVRVYAYDLRGHGETTPEQEDRGYFADREGIELLLSDVERMLEAVRADLLREGLNNIPLCVLGHSMGSFITSCYLKKHGTIQTDGVILSGTTAKPGPVGLARAIARLQCKVLGPKSEGKLLTKIAFGPYNAKIDPVRTANDWLTRDEQIVDAYNADPGCTFKFKAAGFADLFGMLGEIGRKNWTGAVAKDLKILILSGQMDPVGNYGKGPEILYQWFRETDHDCELKLYPDGRHEMLNELNRDAAINDVKTFLRSLRDRTERSKSAMASGPGSDGVNAEQDSPRDDA